MKKRPLLAVLVTLALILSLAGCGSTDPGSVSEENSGAGSAGVEVADEGYITLDGYYNTLVISTNDADFPTYETQSVVYAGAVGTTLAEAMAAIGDVSVEAVAEGDTFEGWMEFVVHIETDADGFDTYTYERVSDTLYTTEEVLAKPFAREEMVYTAKWAGMDMDSYYVEEDYMWTSDSMAIALDANGGTMTYQFAEGESYDCEFYTYWLMEGETINDLAAQPENGYDPMVSIQKEGAEFAGWTVYVGDSLNWSSEASAEDGEMSLETGMDIEGFEYVILGNGALYMDSVTTEELFALVCDGVTNYYARANWN